MNWYSIFYWLTVADNAKDFFWVFAVIFTIIAAISTFSFIDASTTEEKKDSKKWVMWSYPFAVLFWAGIIFTPSKKDSLLIVAGGGTLQYLTSDSSAKQIPHEMTSFILTQLQSMSQDVKIQVDTKNQKEKILKQAKDMTAEQLLDKIKIDTNFAKIVLDK
jgi:hypothetical protein